MKSETPGLFAGHGERQVAVFIAHVLGGIGAPVTEPAGGIGTFSRGHVVAEFFPGVAHENPVFVGVGAGVEVRIPVGKGGDHADGVKALVLAPVNGVFEADPGTGHVAVMGGRVAIRQSPGTARQPGIAQHKEGRTVGVLQGMAVGRYSHESPPVGVVPFFPLRPAARHKLAAMTVKAGIVGMIGRTAPGPPARRGGDDTVDKAVAAIPKAVNAPVETRAAQFQPGIHFHIGVLVRLVGMQHDLLHLPGAYLRLVAAIILDRGAAGQPGAQPAHTKRCPWLFHTAP